MTNDAQQCNPATGHWEPVQPLPLYSRWSVFKQELRIIWLKLTGRVGWDE